MNARHLYDSEGKRALVAQCGKCNRLWDIGGAPVAGGKHGDRRWTNGERYAYAFEQADRCCDWRCEQCGEPAFSEYQRICRKHLDAERAMVDTKKEAEAFAKAKPHPSPDDAKIIVGERVYDGLRDYLDSADHDELPEYVWCARPIPLHIDADHILERAMESMHEEAIDDIGREQVKGLQTLLDKWCSQFPVISYDVDYTQYVLVPKEVEA